MLVLECNGNFPSKPFNPSLLDDVDGSFLVNLIWRYLSKFLLLVFLDKILHVELLSEFSRSWSMQLLSIDCLSLSLWYHLPFDPYLLVGLRLLSWGTWRKWTLCIRPSKFLVNILKDLEASLVILRKLTLYFIFWGILSTISLHGWTLVQEWLWFQGFCRWKPIVSNPGFAGK